MILSLFLFCLLLPASCFLREPFNVYKTGKIHLSLYLSLYLHVLHLHIVIAYGHTPPLTEHKCVLSLAAECSASVIMAGWCCQSSVQGPRACVFYAIAV